MSNQHRATDEQWATAKKWAYVASDSSCLLELRDRIQQLEAAQHAHTTGPSEADIKAAELEWARTAPGMRSDDRMLALQDQIRDWRAANSAPVQPFTAKYLFTAGNIQQDSFYYDPSDGNSVLFDIANLELGDGCLTPGDNIKIAHRWGEPPASGVYSTINYKIASVSETENRAWTIRAVRVGSAPEPTVRTMLPSGLPVIPDPITRNPLKSDVHASFTSPQPSTLVERVADAIAAQATSAGIVNDRPARAAIRVVAAWLLEQDPEPGPIGRWLGQISTPCGFMADLLMHEADK